MSLASLLPITLTQLRLTAELVAATALPFTRTFVRTDADPVYVRLNGTGLAGAVVVTITGELNGTAQTETITVPAAAPSIVLSLKTWTKVTQIATGSTGVGTVRADAVHSDGQAAYVETTISSTLKGRMERARQFIGSLDNTRQGSVLNERWALFVEHDVLLPKDIIVVNGARYEVQNLERSYGGTAVHHIEAELHRLA